MIVIVLGTYMYFNMSQLVYEDVISVAAGNQMTLPSHSVTPLKILFILKFYCLSVTELLFKISPHLLEKMIFSHIFTAQVLILYSVSIV